MSDAMQKFLTIGRQKPPKRDSKERILDYGEVYNKFGEVQARQQAGRCAQCGNPGCEYGCPLGNYILDWLRHVGEGKIQEAFETSRSTNTFPEICGRICPQDRLCEKNCVLEHIDEGAVTIGAIEAWIQDQAIEKGLEYSPYRKPANGIKVAVIGSGPGGLACADELNKLGYEVTIFEKASRPGGLMMFGIPNFKFEKSLILRRIEEFKSFGIQFQLNSALGRDFSLQDLKHQGYAAVFLAFGAYAAKPLTISNHDSRFVHKALPYLIQTNKMNLNLPFEAKDDIAIKDKDVVVLGGGDTAMDCVRTSVRKGAKSVICVYRRDRANMPGSQAEVTHAMEEGVQFNYLSDAIGIEEEGDHSLVTVRKMQLGDPDSTGRRSVLPTEDTYQLKADVILVAYGFDVERFEMFATMGIQIGKGGQIIVDDFGQTTAPGVFAGGDCVRGASLVVWAIRDGRDVAKNMHTYLNQSLRSQVS